MKPTLDQAGKVLELISQSGRTDDWVQEHLIGSGAFSDLLAVNNLRDMNRDDRRRFLGLKPLQPSLLEPLGIITIAATPELVASERFVVGGKIQYVGDNFKLWFYGKTEKRAARTKLRYAKLTRWALDDEIRKEIDAEREETTLAEIWALLKRQPNGESGELLTDGRANIFYVKDVSGTLRAVYVRWNAGGGGWDVGADSVTGPDGWSDGDRVFSRNS